MLVLYTIMAVVHILYMYYDVIILVRYSKKHVAIYHHFAPLQVVLRSSGTFILVYVINEFQLIHAISHAILNL